MDDLTRRQAVKLTAVTGAVSVGSALLAGTVSAQQEHQKKGDEYQQGAQNAPEGVLLQPAELERGGEDIPQTLRTAGWASVKLYFGQGDEFRNAVVTVSSAWGEGNNGRDLWGWTGGAGVSHSETKKDDGGYYFIYSLQHPIGQSRFIAANFRYVLGSGAHGVASAFFRFPA